eukprot:GSChrysophyteH1.ASY1.ANO1.3099.1 assembled CDS
MSSLTKLGALRASLRRLRLDAFIIGSADAHQSEYVCDRDLRRAYLSDFTGSSGTALVLEDKALLWTDGRYFLQASQQLSEDWTLMRSGDPGALGLEKALQDKGVTLVAVEENPVDAQWHDQPGFPLTKANALCVSMLDEIAWLFNIRGTAHLFCDETKIDMCVHPYSSVKNGNKSNHVLSPLTLSKSIKNETELNGIRNAHIKDGVALTAFLCWLEQTVQLHPNSLTEYDVALKLEEFRHKMDGHQYPSFDTIAGYASNGAVIHYKPEKETALKLGVDSLFLLDSGGQYLDGTTDVTRTMHYGTPTERMMECYTMVLKGHIALAQLVFPEGTVGSRFDSVARIPLWQAGLDYNHGTGHGVGAYLNVHEGPQGIGFRKRENEAGFKIGMTTSNEPGYYEAGAFGIRIENTVTLTPISTSLIKHGVLSPSEIEWVNDYHREVREKLLPGIKKYFPEAESWLIRETEAI